jgi:ABC-type Mn2+/Zn2+ transport system ATPase subunit
VAEPLLRFRGATLGYGGRAVLRGLDLCVCRGELWFVVGPNGSGKTTLLRAVLGACPPLAGEVWLHPTLASREALAYLPQRPSPAQGVPSTVTEQVDLGLVGLGLRRRERVARVDEALGAVGMRALARRDWRALSGGERQRAYLARALARRPALLLLDEPTAALDLPTEARLLALLRELHRDRALTLLVVTHDLRLAERHATHLAVVHQGAVSVQAAPEGLANLQALYLEAT